MKINSGQVQRDTVKKAGSSYSRFSSLSKILTLNLKLVLWVTFINYLYNVIFNAVS